MHFSIKTTLLTLSILFNFQFCSAYQAKWFEQPSPTSFLSRLKSFFWRSKVTMPETELLNKFMYKPWELKEEDFAANLSHLSEIRGLPLTLFLLRFPQKAFELTKIPYYKKLTESPINLRTAIILTSLTLPFQLLDKFIDPIYFDRQQFFIGSFICSFFAAAITPFLLSNNLHHYKQKTIVEVQNYSELISLSISQIETILNHYQEMADENPLKTKLQKLLKAFSNNLNSIIPNELGDATPDMWREIDTFKNRLDNALNLNLKNSPSSEKLCAMNNAQEVINFIEEILNNIQE